MQVRKWEWETRIGRALGKVHSKEMDRGPLVLYYPGGPGWQCRIHRQGCGIFTHWSLVKNSSKGH